MAQRTASLQLSDSIAQLPGVRLATIQRLQQLGLQTIEDLLLLLPHRLEDRSLIKPIASLRFEEEVVIEVVVLKVTFRLTKKGSLMIQAAVSDSSGQITAVWFNQRYLLRYLKPGSRFLLYGQKKLVGKLGPLFLVKKIITQAEIAPIYPSTAGLSQETIRRLLSLVQPLSSQLADLIPPKFRQLLKLPPRSRAIASCHFAATPQALTTARQLLGFEELTLLFLNTLQAKALRLKQQATPIKIDTDYLQVVANSLPFPLTDHQRKAVWEIVQDLRQSVPMNRLLYGEVGSGKTVVGLLVASLVLRAGHQVAWLNPTVALAAQQVDIARQLLGRLGITIAFFTSHRKEEIAKADLIIGTHALLQQSRQFRSLGLVIIDEQHRFGVKERQALLGSYPAAHALMMTATPIPRSLAQTVFGHLDLTYLNQKPLRQQPVRTLIVYPSQRLRAEQEIAERLKRGEPGYVICPLIESPTISQGTLFDQERKTIRSEEQRLKTIFPQARLQILHGRLTPAQKEKIVSNFRRSQIDILLSTTVVEVGIDNPQATWILIEEADRFGLAQLHQLRGRVGRGVKPSVCFLIPRQSNPLADQRLRILAETVDGLALAQQDLALRGPGEIMGLEQSGLPALKYADLADQQLVQAAFQAATAIITDGLDQYPKIKQAMRQVANHNDELVRA